ncbi:MAG: Na+/solute symporter [Verrucomicrobiales bacterium]|jgi:SSS family solute:Na+ symporter|nr:Na+/solute symporter [Verrucomicrobiales bacterium]
MTSLDYVVLVATMLGIAVYGIWKTRRHENLSGYLKGERTQGWATIGLSVMATQASAITFLSTPGQGYENGMGFVQNYFAMPIALIIIAAVFLPMYRHLNVYTAYEYLGRRFDSKTRLLGAGLFLLQRGLSAGITIYAPAIILSTVMGWRLDLTILFSGILVIIYTVSGGSECVSITQKYQMALIFAGMGVAFGVLIHKLTRHATLHDALTLAGSFQKMEAVDFSFDVKKRYTIWSGLFGGMFLMLSYFGTDQSQVQRYLSGSSLRESRLGLMFNAVLKIPMQFLILLTGVLVFVFYQFEQPPLFFNQSTAKQPTLVGKETWLEAQSGQYAQLHAHKKEAIEKWLAARRAPNPSAEKAAHKEILRIQEWSENVRTNALAVADPKNKSKDSDYVFITFVTHYLPHGIVGLLVAVIFAAALSSKASELNALGSTTTVDFYKHVIRKDATDLHYIAASKWFTALWGMVALGFALFANLAENLIQAVNIIGSIFYGVVLGLFMVAFFLRKVGGTSVFWGAVLAQLMVFALFFTLKISYLWYNLIGCAGCVLFSLVFQAFQSGSSSSAGREVKA